jgi:hypothetical protein
MDAEALAPGAAAPGTLAAGEIVWGKPKGRRRPWWPARLLAACPAPAARVAYFGAPFFADPDADGMARASAARPFFAAVQEAHAAAVAALRSALTCGCVPPPPSTEAGVVPGVTNLSPAEFLAALRTAAVLGGAPVGVVDRAKLKSWVCAFGEGWGPGGAGHYPRRAPAELVDKIDLDVPASDKEDDDGWLSDDKDEHEAPEGPRETPAESKKKKCGSAACTDEVDSGEDEDKNDSATGMGASRKRERKRSRYLSPAYTNSGALILPRKLSGLPKAFTASAAEYDSEVVLSDSIVVEEVLLLVLGVAKDVSHGSRFPKEVESFLCSFRSKEFKCLETEFYVSHESPAAHGVGTVDVDMAAVGVVSDDQTVLKQGKRAAKRSRKKDDDGGTSSFAKRKKGEKHFPGAMIGCDLPITPAVPIRQVKAEDITSEMKAVGGARFLAVGVKDEKFKPSAFKCEISPAIPDATRSGKENDDTKLRDGKEPSLFKCAIPAAALEAAKSRQEEQHVDGFAGKTAQAVDNTFSDQSAERSDEAKFGDGKSDQSVFK